MKIRIRIRNRIIKIIIIMIKFKCFIQGLYYYLVILFFYFVNFKELINKCVDYVIQFMEILLFLKIDSNKNLYKMI